MRTLTIVNAILVVNLLMLIGFTITFTMNMYPTNGKNFRDNINKNSYQTYILLSVIGLTILADVYGIYTVYKVNRTPLAQFCKK